MSAQVLIALGYKQECSHVSQFLSGVGSDTFL